MSTVEERIAGLEQAMEQVKANIASIDAWGGKKIGPMIDALNAEVTMFRSGCPHGVMGRQYCPRCQNEDEELADTRERAINAEDRVILLEEKMVEQQQQIDRLYEALRNARAAR